MSNRRRLILAAAAGASLLVLAAAAASRSGPAQRATATAGDEPASASSPPVARAALVASSPRPGSRRIYEVDLAQAVVLSGADGKATGSAEASGMTRRIRAGWTATCVSNEGGRVRYRGVLRDVDALANGQPYPEGDLRKDFLRPFFFVTDAEGKVVSLAFDPKTGDDARQVIKSLVAGSQVVLRGEGEESWVAREEDPTGEYEARYLRDTDPARLHKTRARYLRVATDKGLRDVSEAGEVSVEDDTRIALDADAKLESLASKTDTDVQFGSGMPRVHVTATLAIRLEKADTRDEGAAAANDEWKRQAEEGMAASPARDDAKTRQATQRAADARVVQQATLADLEKDLTATGRGLHRERAAQVARFRSDFRLHPEDTQKVLAFVRYAPVADGQAITAALGGAETPQAMKALVDVANSRETPLEVRVNAIGALAINPTPSSEGVQALKQMSADSNPDISSASTLALGAAAATLATSDPATYEDAIGALLADLAAARTPQAKILDLRALGNSGDARVLPAAEQNMSGEEAPVRVAAVAAVRFVAGAETDRFVVGAMQSDADPSVRIQAIATAYGYRTVASYVPTLGAVLQSDPAPLVRREALQALNVVKTTPEALALITAAARSDESQDCREYAQAILDSLAVAQK